MSNRRKIKSKRHAKRLGTKAMRTSRLPGTLRRKDREARKVQP